MFLIKKERLNNFQFDFIEQIFYTQVYNGNLSVQRIIIFFYHKNNYYKW